MNQFFNSHQQNQQQRFGQGFDLNAALQYLARQIAPTGMTPEQVVRQLLQNDRMKPEQFNQYAQIADQLTGRRR